MAPTVALLGATVLAIPLFRRLGLGSVLGYFAAGVAVGPFGLRMFSDPEAILHVAELGVVLLQVLACIVLLTTTGVAGFGYPLIVAFAGSAGFVPSSTAVIISVMQEQGELAVPEGQKSVAILLFEDLMIVPLLAIIALLAPIQTSEGNLWVSTGTGLVAIAFLLAAGRWLMDPMFALLARACAGEAMSRRRASGRPRRGPADGGCRPFNRDGRVSGWRDAVHGADAPVADRLATLDADRTRRFRGY